MTTVVPSSGSEDSRRAVEPLDPPPGGGAEARCVPQLCCVSISDAARKWPRLQGQEAAGSPRIPSEAESDRRDRRAHQCLASPFPFVAPRPLFEEPKEERNRPRAEVKTSRGSTEIATEASGDELGGTRDVRERKGGPGEAVAAAKERRGTRERRQNGMVTARSGLWRLSSAELLGCGTR